MSELIAVNQPSDREVLVFELGGEEYAVDILKVQEIRGQAKITRIANVPEFIRGVTNLRGEIVPVVDLRLKFNVGDGQMTDKTVTVVLNIGTRIVGIVVDAVSDVLSLSGEQIRPAPSFGAEIDTAYLHGLANVDDRMLIVLDVDAMMNSHDMALIDSIDETR